ncbi:MAG: hypothetical protein IT196_02995 [Acidimicrobiales bacterium]|nr:hypothetical protein [Acidimicrobiales bacterium]
MARWSTDLGVAVQGTLSFDGPSNAVWFVAADGRLGSLRVLGQRLSWHGEGWEDAAAAVPLADGLNLAVIHRNGAVDVVAMADAGAAVAHRILALAGTVIAAAGSEHGLVALLATGDLVSVDVATASAATIATGIDTPLGLAVDHAGRALIAAGVPPELFRIDLADGQPVGETLALTETPAALTGHPWHDGALVAGATGLAAALWTATDTHIDATPAVSALARWHSLVLAAAGTTIELIEWGDDVARLPLTAAPDPLVAGGWVPLHVDYAAAGLDPAEVVWRVAEGPEAGGVSVARPADGDRFSYEHRVLAGTGFAEFTVEAGHAVTGEILGSRRFRTVDVWPDVEVGPPMAITGEQRVYARWGGGSAGPENVRIHPAPEVIELAVVVLRTKGASSTVDGQARVDRFEEVVLADTGESVLRFYEEVSGRNRPAGTGADPKGSTVSLLGGRVFGPIDVPYAWGDLFAPANQSDPWGSWDPKDGTWDVLGGTFSSHLQDLGLAEQVSRNADSVVFAVLPGTDDPYKVGGKQWSAQWTWAYAGDAQLFHKTQFATSFQRRPATIMPAAFPANHPTAWAEREWVTALCHELGHNLGCPDLYNKGSFPAEVGGRTMGSWDLMDTDIDLPHLSLAHRMRLGWVNPAWVEVFNFAQNPSGRSVRLQAAETIARSGPTGGRKAGIEVRIRPGWNYYFEYRRQQAGQVGDQSLPVAQAILGTDVNLPAAEEVDRPLILQLPADVDGDGPVLRTAGTDYEESDVTNPDRLNDFRLTRQRASVLGRDPNEVTVQVDYVGAHRAELQIRPAPGRGKFKSPDISIDGPGGADVVVKGKTVKIKVSVRNAGSKGANDVNIRVQWLPFTTSAGPWNALPSPARQTIPSNQSRAFIVDWAVPASMQLDGKEVEHFCVRVDVDRYTDPLDPNGDEIVVHNNWAQSNFATPAVGYGSPSERRSTALAAHNKLPVRATHRTVLQQTGEHFRAYVGASWMALDAGQSGVTTLDYESLSGDAALGEAFALAVEHAEGEQIGTDLSATGFLFAPTVADGPLERFGAQLFVRAGRRTFIEVAAAQGEAVLGQVLAGWPEDAVPVDGGEVRVTGWLVDLPDEQFWRDSTVRPDGSFVAFFPEQLFELLQIGRCRLAVHYLGTGRFAPCHSEDLEVN